MTLEGLKVNALGAARVWRGDRLLEPADWTYRKPRELLYFLLGARSRGKNEIGLAMWPDASAANLRNSLHTTIRYARRALGSSDCLTYSSGRYAFNRARPYVYDVEIFESRMDAANTAELLERALGTYSGDFLADMAGGPWIEERRLALRFRAELGLHELGRLLLADGEPERAARVSMRLLALDELSEPAHRLLMNCYAGMGDRSRAVRQYTNLSGRLADELGIKPATETTELYLRLRAS